MVFFDMETKTLRSIHNDHENTPQPLITFKFNDQLNEINSVTLSIPAECARFIREYKQAFIIGGEQAAAEAKKGFVTGENIVMTVDVPFLSNSLKDQIDKLKFYADTFDTFASVTK